MRILISGNMGYVGPALVKHLRQTFPDAYLAGLDTGYFAKMVTGTTLLPEAHLNVQYFGDVRSLPANILSGFDTVICLAAISNDPIGNRFEQVTLDINAESAIELARQAKTAGVRRFVFASSCSVYGFAEDGAKTEQSEVGPLTAYARSKVAAEEGLAPLASDDFIVTCHRFATACGFSDRLRLDLVLNDFVAGALTSGKIGILSDGTPWRPLINVADMAVAMEWSATRSLADGGNYLVVNTGADQWNYQVRELADAVAEAIPGTEVSVNPSAPPDKRSYRVDFGLFKSLAPNHQPRHTLQSSIEGLVEGLRSMGFADERYRESDLIRLHIVSKLLDKGEVDEKLYVR
ncbi:SDR family oxidoreductase [Nostoc sp. NIES-2111]